MGICKSLDTKWRVNVVVLAHLPNPRAVPLDVVLECETLGDAMVRSWELAPEGLTQSRVADALGLPKQHFGSMVAGLKYLPNHLVGAYCRAVGNTLLRQWLDLYESRLARTIERHRRGAVHELARATG